MIRPDEIAMSSTGAPQIPHAVRERVLSMNDEAIAGIISAQSVNQGCNNTSNCQNSPNDGGCSNHNGCAGSTNRGCTNWDGCYTHPT